MCERACRPVPGPSVRNSCHAATQPHLVDFSAILLTSLAEAKVPVDACMVVVRGEAIIPSGDAVVVPMTRIEGVQQVGPNYV